MSKETFVGCPKCKFPAINSAFPVYKKGNSNTKHIHWFCKKCGWEKLEKFDESQ